MQKIFIFSLSIFGSIIMLLGINTFTETASADYTDPDAFTMTDPSSDTEQSCPSCAEVNLNLSLPVTSEPPVQPPVTPPPSGGGGSSGGGGGGSSGGGGGGSSGLGSSVPVKKIETPAAIDQILPPVSLVATTSKTVENISIEKNIESPSFSSLFGLEKGLAETISLDESKKVTGRETKVQFGGNNTNLYKKIIASESAYSEKVKISVAYFIEVGTPTTKNLGSGERAGVINSYLAAFGRMASTDTHWQDVIKIANGRWPAEKNLAAEAKAVTKFKKIYLRAPNLKQANDNAAVTIMAYGLRPVKRNTNSEKSAILSFKYVYKKAPTSAEDWDIVRAIAYSGAKR